MYQKGDTINGKYHICSIESRSDLYVDYFTVNEAENRAYSVRIYHVAADNEYSWRSFVQATLMLNELKHPNLPAFNEIIEIEEGLLIAWDFISHNPISKYIAEKKIFERDDLFFWMEDLCKVLGYLHTRKEPIFTGGFDADDIFLRVDGFIFLLNIDKALMFRTFKNLRRIDSDWSAFYAPELRGKTQNADARTDIYSLGAVMYYLATGCEPHPLNDMTDTSLTGHIPTLDYRLERLIIKCLQADPADRFQSCSELIFEIDLNLGRISFPYSLRPPSKCFLVNIFRRFFVQKFRQMKNKQYKKKYIKQYRFEEK